MQPQHKLTQEELLEEAKITERLNLESLEYLEKLEEEKKKFQLHKPQITGPRIIFYSKQGVDLLTFSDPNISFWNTTPNSLKGRSICPITGLQAKYFDPKTNSPYATVEAFKKLREK